MKDARAVKQIAHKQAPRIINHGIVRAVRGQYIDVVLDGSGKQVHQVVLDKSITVIEVGWWVTVVRHPRTNRWQAIAAYEDAASGSVSRADELPVPANAVATGKPYLIEFSWAGSFQDVATYEVQHNSSAAEAGATNVKVEGSNFFYWCAPGTTRHFRVRGVSSTYKRSSWSAWDDDTSDAGVAYMFLGVNAGATAAEWQAFDWDNVSGVGGADMVHNHHTAAEGGVELWPDRLGVGTASLPAMDGVIGLAAAADRPPFAPGEGRYYCKDVSGRTEGFYEDDVGNEVQLTRSGALNAIVLLGSAVVDTQNGDGKTTSFTVPTGKSAIITHVIIHSPSGSLAGGTDFDIGSGANADTWRQTIDLSSMTATTDYIVIPSISAVPIKYTLEAGGAAFGIKPITGATADTTATMAVFGYLI